MRTERWIRNTSVLMLLAVTMVCITNVDKVIGAGIVYASAVAFCFFLNFQRIKLDKLIFVKLLILTASLLIFVMCTGNGLSSGRLNTAIIMYGTVAVIFLISFNQNSRTNILSEKYYFIFYYLLWFWCCYQLAYFAYSNISAWELRLSFAHQTFPFGWHHVDMSVAVAFIVFCGMKLRTYISSVLLAVMGLIILPSRTFFLFIFSFVLLRILRRPIEKLVCIKLFNNCFKWFIWLFIGSLLLSYIWVFVMPLFNVEIAEGHQGIYDTSQWERFRTNWYAIAVIVKEKLFFTGLDSNLDYGSLVQEYSLWNIVNGPHNSYISVLLYYSAGFGVCYYYVLAQIVDRFWDKKQIPYIFSWMLVGVILHDMFTGLRLFMFLALLILPFQEESILQRGGK